MLKEDARMTAETPEDELEPIKFVLSTHGGEASEMFSIYDVMKSVEKECPIHTAGIGKVMSSGVLELARDFLKPSKGYWISKLILVKS